MVSRPVTVNDVLDGHVALDLECLDRIYLNGYVPNLQVGGQVVSFLTAHLGFPIPSPAIFDQIGGRFRRAVAKFAKDNQVPVVRFGKGDRKIEVMQPHLERAAAGGVSKVAAIGVAQEFASVFTATAGDRQGGAPWFSFAKADRRVTCYYFYLWDEDFGAAFVKVCCYFPYPMKIWVFSELRPSVPRWAPTREAPPQRPVGRWKALPPFANAGYGTSRSQPDTDGLHLFSQQVNGHEWAKRQASKAGIGFTALSNGFASCDDPVALQAICDRLGPGTIRVFAERWWARLPLPLTPADRAAGYWWDISMRQVEVSRTMVFDAPRHGRAFFEALVGDNLDLGRPDSVEVIFARKVTKATPGPFTTRVITRGVDVTVNAYYKRSRIKQYLKDGRALRIETVVNDTTDLDVKRRLEHLDLLQAKARAVNRRVVETERVGQGCVLASPAFERVARPTVTDGRRAPALRFGDPRVMALVGALAIAVNTVTGFTNRSLRAQVSALLGVDYTMGQASYDLRRLRLKGLIVRLPHSNTYVLTPDGIKVAVFYTKLHDRLLRPLLAADHPPAPLPVRQALRTLDHAVDDYINNARMAA